MWLRPRASTMVGSPRTPERLREHHVVVVDGLLSHARVLVDRVVARIHFATALHAVVVFLHVGLGVAEEAGIADAAVGARGAAVRVIGEARVVDEAAVVGRPLLIVGLAVVLRALQERRSPSSTPRCSPEARASFIALSAYSRLMMSARRPSARVVPP